MNKNLQVETRAGAVWGDGVFFAISDCNYGCIGSPDDWKPGMHPVPKNSYPGEEQATQATSTIRRRRGGALAVRPGI